MIQTAGRDLTRIIRVIVNSNPDVAAQLDSILQPGLETNLDRIFFYYSRFDNIELKGYNEVNKRRLFTAVMLQLYHPYCLKNSIVNVKYGFGRNIAACFSCKRQSIERNIREVVVLYKAYEEFGEKVNEVFEQFKKL